jgi:hypothetical protein
MTSIHPSRLLTFALRADAALSGSVATLQLLLTGWLADRLQLPHALLVQTGVFLVAYANLLLWLASRSQLAAAWIGMIIVGNLAWALACLGLWVSGAVSPSALGAGFLLVHAAAVLAFAGLEFRGLRRSARAASKANTAVRSTEVA